MNVNISVESSDKYITLCLINKICGNVECAEHLLLFAYRQACWTRSRRQAVADDGSRWARRPSVGAACCYRCRLWCGTWCGSTCRNSWQRPGAPCSPTCSLPAATAGVTGCRCTRSLQQCLVSAVSRCCEKVAVLWIFFIYRVIKTCHQQHLLVLGLQNSSHCRALFSESPTTQRTKI